MAAIITNFLRRIWRAKSDRKRREVMQHGKSVPLSHIAIRDGSCEHKVHARASCLSLAVQMQSWVFVAVAIVIWGVTFASTRELLEDFSSLEILLLRFSLAWVALWGIERLRGIVKVGCWRDEWIFAAMGFTGIVAYQFLENCAIYYTNASNVAILVSFGPVVTAFMARVFVKGVQFSVRLVVGSLVAVCGVALISFNGLVEFELRPIGDAMALCAMACWGFYSILLDCANDRGVSPLVAIRKAFGWSLAMMVPFAAWGTTESGICALDGSFAVILDADVNAERFASVANWMNIAFLGFLASAASFVLWSAACRTIGVVKMTVALYITPIVGVVFAAVFLGERVTQLEIVGGIVILVGVVLSTKVKGGGK